MKYQKVDLGEIEHSSPAMTSLYSPGGAAKISLFAICGDDNAIFITPIQSIIIANFEML
jgi:hypothetical protein